MLFVVVAAVFGWGRWQANERKREAAVIEQLSELHCDVVERILGAGLAGAAGGRDVFPSCIARNISIGPSWVCVVCVIFPTRSRGFFGGAGRGAQQQRVRENARTRCRATYGEPLRLMLKGDIADANREQLARLKSLEEVCLDGNRISDFGVACLAKLPNCGGCS